MASYLAADPENMTLLADTAWAAYEAGERDLASELVSRASHAVPPTPRLRNLALLLAIADNRLEEADALALSLLAESPGDPGLLYDRAWIAALERRFAAANALLTPEAAAASAEARAFKVRLLHHVHAYDEALGWGEEMIAKGHLEPALLGALALVAMDADQPALARSYAEAGAGGAEAELTLGLFAIEEGAANIALSRFDAALTAQPAHPRAWAGRGLALLSLGDPAGASAALEKAARLFETHLGTWVALGWARLIAGDRSASRAAFAQAVAIDDNFGEGHGGLAVLDILDGDAEGGTRHAKLAARLDRAGLGAMLAHILLAEGQGKAEVAERIWRQALGAPIGENGQTLEQAVAVLARSGGRR
ncbi:MAG: hypothetical protein JSS55_06410 [Proteobacteria bacterium]|nr:hypothetical protein [Pseudomonadota bacterium]